MECSELREQMMEVLYGEADPVAKQEVEEHQAGCSACREELAALRRLRRQLAAWKAPSLGPRPRRFSAGLWLASAAALLVALGAALGFSGSELSYRDGRLAFRLGRAGDLQPLLAAQEARHRQETRALSRSLAAASLARDEAALLHRVDEMIHQSEARQAVLLSASLAELGERAEAQRRYDMARVSAGLSYLDGRTGEQLARTTQLVGYLLRAAHPQDPPRDPREK